MTATDLIRDAAAPIAQALDVRVPPVDVLIAYTSSGAVVRVADRSSAHREVIEGVFRDAFTSAGWGVAARRNGGLRLDHPVELARPSR